MQHASDPWHTPVPDTSACAEDWTRYRRAVALSRMRLEVQRYGDKLRYRDAVAYRLRCIANWQHYLAFGEPPNA